jgi:hypothetical protein
MTAKPVDSGAIPFFLPSFNHKTCSKVVFGDGWARSSGTKANRQEPNAPNRAGVWVGGTPELVFVISYTF